MRRDHRPYFLKKADQRIQQFYTNHFLKPQFERFGKGAVVFKPWHVEVFGGPVAVGDYPAIIASFDRKVRFCVWPEPENPQNNSDGIVVGDYCLISPGVRISAAAGVTIGNNCMIASGAYITDSDWHGVYNRTAAGRAVPVTIADNVWIGDSAIVCKGVQIGENSIVGAGGVVTRDVPANVIIAGNPAQVVKKLDSDKPLVRRETWYADPERLFRDFDIIDQEQLSGNSLLHWIRHLLFPGQGE